MFFAIADRPGADRPDAHELAPIRKLAEYRELAAGEVALLRRLLGAKVEHVRTGVPLIADGEVPADLHIVLSGWACRTRAASRGRRQIVAFHLPGDIIDFDVFLMKRMDSTITALSDLRVAAISRSVLGQVTKTAPRLAQSLWWDSLSSASIQREWMMRVAQGSARERICGLICEIVTRLRAVGLVRDDCCEVPLRQADLANACGLTPEHANRTLRELRTEGLFTLDTGLLRIHDRNALSAIADFDPSYLHFRLAEDTARSADETNSLAMAL